jgi:hypothetical protein
MAYTQTAPVAPTMAGTTVTYSAVPAGGLALLPGSILLVKNGSGSSITVTVRVQKGYKGYTLADFTTTVAPVLSRRSARCWVRCTRSSTRATPTTATSWWTSPR